MDILTASIIVLFSIIIGLFLCNYSKSLIDGTSGCFICPNKENCCGSCNKEFMNNFDNYIRSNSGVNDIGNNYVKTMNLAGHQLLIPDAEIKRRYPATYGRKNCKCSDCLWKYPTPYNSLTRYSYQYPKLKYLNKMRDPYFTITTELTPGKGYGNYMSDSLRPKRVRSNWFPFRYQVGPWSSVLAKGTFKKYQNHGVCLNNTWLNLSDTVTGYNLYQ